MLRLLSLGLLLAVWCPQASGQGGFGNKIQLGIIADGYVREDGDFIEMFQDEVEQLLGNDYKFEVLERNILLTHWQSDVASEGLQRLREDPEVEMIVGLGILASHLVSTSGPYAKPALAALIVDADLQGAPLNSSGSTGSENLVYTLSPFSPMRDLEVFRSIYPFRSLAILMGSNVTTGISELRPYFDKRLTGFGSAFEILTVEQQTTDVLQRLRAGFDAVYVGPLLFIKDQLEAQKLIDGINDLKLPSFSLIGIERDCEKSTPMASIAQGSNQQRLARRLALNIERILEGDLPGEIPVSMKIREELVINMATARRIRFAPSFDIAAEATLLCEEAQAYSETRDFIGSIYEALQSNLDLAASTEEVAAAGESVRESRSNLLPHADVSATGLIIDEDRAAASFGSQPQYTGALSVGGSQVIFSEGLLANTAIAKHQRKAVGMARRTTEMDVILQTAVAYLNILRAKTGVRIARDNLQLTRKNLDLARVRQEIGYSGPSDQYRWESQIAFTQKNLLDAEAGQRIAEVELNRVLNRPLNQVFATEEIELSDSFLITTDARLYKYIDNEITYGYFGDFMVEQGMENLPELRELDALVAAADRFTAFSRRSFFLPSLGLQGGLDYRFHASGAGSTPVLDPGFPTADDVNWNLGVSASFPLFTGGFRTAQLNRGKAESRKLNYSRAAVRQLMEQRIRNSVELIAVSYTNIGLSRLAKEASRKNFALVQDAYSEGLVDIIQLIDAQNAAVQGDQAAANAIYEFAIDLLNLERSSGFYYSLATAQARDNFFNRLAAYLEREQN